MQLYADGIYRGYVKVEQEFVPVIKDALAAAQWKIIEA